MQISALKKLLQLIRSSESPSEKRSSEATSESKEAESDVNSSECGVQNEMPSDEEIIKALKDEGEITISEEEKDGFLAEEIKAEGEPDSVGERVATVENNRSHLTSSVPRAARVPMGAITKQELAEMRSLFRNLDDFEIQRLYKKVTKQN